VSLFRPEHYKDFPSGIQSEGEIGVRFQGPQGRKIFTSIMAGVAVWLVSAAANIALLQLDRTGIVRVVVGTSIGGLMAVVVSLALQLRHEEVHYRVAVQRAAIVAELNHHVRNAVFPLCIAVQRLGNTDANKIADDAVERINLALKDATADALAGTVDYSEPEQKAA
jgi:hypothetical protein